MHQLGRLIKQWLGRVDLITTSKEPHPESGTLERKVEFIFAADAIVE